MLHVAGGLLHVAQCSLSSLGRAVALAVGHKLKFGLPFWWKIFVACQKKFTSDSIFNMLAAEIAFHGLSGLLDPHTRL